MAGYGLVQSFFVGTASGASTSSYLDTGGRPFSQMAVHINSMSTGAEVTVYGCDSASGTFQPVKIMETGTSTVAFNNLAIGTATSGGWAVIPAPPHRYIQFITSAVVSGGVSFTVIANG
jgi:hypothetical protein